MRKEDDESVVIAGDAPAQFMRKAAGITQKDLGDRLGVLQTGIAKGERRGRSVLLTTLDRIAEVCGYTIELRLHRRR